MFVNHFKRDKNRLDQRVVWTTGTPVDLLMMD